MKNKYAHFFAAYNASVKAGNRLTKEEMISSFTGGATESIKDLNPFQLNELVRNLNSLVPKIEADKGKADKMRKAIIAIFRSRGLGVADAIAWAEKQGVRGTKKLFNEYTTGELFVLISIAEKVKADYNKSLRTKISNTINN